MTEQIIESVWTDDAIEALRQRNAERVRRAIEQLGPAYVLYKRPSAPIPISIDATVNNVPHSRA